MTVGHLFKEVLPGIKSADRVPLSTLKSRRIGVDANIWLHVIASTSEDYVFKYNVHPQYPPRDVVTKFAIRHNTLVRAGITPAYVFDGYDHIMKSVARAKRVKTVEKAEQKLNALKTKALALDQGVSLSEAEIREIKKNMKIVSKPTDEMREAIVSWLKETKVEVYMAPFEAEWQLVYLESKNMIDGIISEDGDTIILGGLNVYLGMSMNSSTVFHYSRKKLMEEYDTYKHPESTLNLPADANHLVPMANFLGNDFIRNIDGVGPTAILRGPNCLLRRYIVSVDKVQFLTQYLTEVGVDSTSYIARFLQASALFNHCPVYDPSTKQLVPLRPLPINEETDEQWGRRVGFLRSPLAMLPSGLHDKLDDAYNLRGHAFRGTGGSLPKYNGGPTYVYNGHNYNSGVNNAETTPMPDFAVLDEDWPIKACPTEVILRFVACHGGTNQLDGTREMLDREGLRIQLEQVPVVPPSTVVPQIEAWQVYEVLQPLEGQQWTDNWWQYVTGDTATVTLSSAKDMARLHWFRNENITERIGQLVWSGNFDLTKIQSLKCQSVADGTEKLIFRCPCIPSMKSQADKVASKRPRTTPDDIVTTANAGLVGLSMFEEEDNHEDGYIVYLCYEQGARKQPKLLQYPFSSCGCPNGRTVCSHVFAFEELLSLAATANSKFDDDKESFVRNMPSCPLSTQKAPMLIELLVVQDQLGRSLAQATRRAA